MSETNNTRQAVWVGIGSLFSFGFTIVSTMILSRYFDKGDYGTYKQVMYVYNTLITVFTLGLPKAFSYFLPRVEKSQAKHLIKKITNLFFILGGVFSLFLFLCAQPIADVMKNQDLVKAIKIFSPVPLMMLPTMGLEGILSTYRQNKFMALYTVLTRIFMFICVAIPVAFFNCGYIEAIIGFTISSFVTFLFAIYLKYMPVRNAGNDDCNIKYKDIFNFSIPLLTASLWGILVHSADQFFISRYFGNEVFAEFSNGAMELPFVGMIIGACANVLSPIFSRLNHEKVNPQKEVLPLWKSVFEKSAMLIYPLLIYSIVFADIIMVFLYGSEYEISANYFRIVTSIDFFKIIVFAPLLINVGEVKFYSRTFMYNTILVVIFEYLSVITIRSPYAIIIISALLTIARIFWMLSHVAKYFNVSLLNLFPVLLLSKIVLPSIVFLIGEHYLLYNIAHLDAIVSLVLSFSLYAIFMLAVSKLVGIDYISLIKPLMNKKINKSI